MPMSDVMAETAMPIASSEPADPGEHGTPGPTQAASSPPTQARHRR